MKLPTQIPKSLRTIAITLDEMDEWEAAWSREQAIEVVKSLKGSRVIVTAVTVFELIPGGYAPSEVAWSAARLPNEPDYEFAQRSQTGALEFIGEANTSADALVALSFPIASEAA